jgi:hypothetical protein
MALDGLNAAAAAAILNQADVDQATKTRGVIVAAFVPGPLGLAVPVILARNATSEAGEVGPRSEAVPRVVGEQVHRAIDLLMEKKFDVVVDQGYSDKANAGYVYMQRPEEGKKAKPGTAITIFVNDGEPSSKITKKDLLKKLGNLQTVLVDTIDEAEARIEHRLEARLKHARIEQRAYDIWVRQGCPAGRAEENWQQAEREIQ